MNKKTFKKPTLEVIDINLDEIIATSGLNGINGNGLLGDFDDFGNPIE